MNYNEIVDDIVSNYQHPCDAEVPAGYYRRVKWEQYNTTLANRGPAINEEWLTEVIPLEKRVYDKNPFGFKSDPLPYPMGTDPEGNPTDPSTTCGGIWSTKIGYCFATQQALKEYVESIGSTLQPDNNWYGADLSKKSLFKNSRELEMYRLENTGAIWTLSGPRIDKRTCMRYDANTQAATLIDFNGTGTSRSAYLKHYEDQPCTYVGMRVNSNADTSIPGKPVSVDVDVGALPLVYAATCLPAAFGFPYNNISKSIMSAWNKTRHEFKVMFEGLPGLVQGAGDRIATMYDNLSVSMEELGQSALAYSQYALQLAWAEFTEIISAAMNIVGGGWNMIKRFLPAVTIAGVKVDILELCTDPNGVQKLKEQIPDTEESINAIYKTIGSSYDYSIEYVKMKGRDIVDALTDFYDWCWSNLQYAGVAMCKLLGELAQIWSIPPEVPNPVWSAIRAVRSIFSQIPPLDIIMSGNFPGFTSSELYTQCMNHVNQERERVLKLVDDIDKRIDQEYQNCIKLKQDLEEKKRKHEQYLRGMWERITAERTEKNEQDIQEADSKVKQSEDKIETDKKERNKLLDSINNILDMALEQLKKLPIMSTVNQLLDLAGASIDSILNVVTNIETGLSSLYEDFIDATRSLKDICKTIYNQCCTLALSKVTQWVNKLLSILSLVIQYPMMSFCAPLIKY